VKLPIYDEELLDAELRDRLVREVNGGGSEPKFCRCVELMIGGKRRPFPQGHDCSWVLRRNELIPHAEQLATERVGEAPRDGETPSGHAHRWTRAFSIAMDRLSERLLKQTNGASPATDEQTVTEDELAMPVRQPMTVPLIAR
jgi:hypothetical protein